MVNGYHPNNLQEALELIEKKELTILAGGTDLMVQKARGTGLAPEFESDLLFINYIKELRDIEITKDEITIGACVTLTELEYNENIPQILRDIISEMASVPTRNLATIGGNICNASPAGDTLPYLYAINAKVELQSSTDRRIVKISEFITGPGKKDLKSNELLKKIVIPKQHFDMEYYKKVGTRKGMALSKLSFVGLKDVEDGKIKDIRMAFGAVGPTVISSEELENEMSGKVIDDNLIESTLDKYRKIITPIDDSRSTQKYRLQTALNLLEAFLNE